MSTRERTLVTGGAGFIGSHIAERLLEVGHSVRIVDNLSTGHERNIEHLLDRVEFMHADLRDPDTCRSAVRDVDTVYHVAALPSVPRSLEDPWASHDANVNATVRLLIACVGAGVRRCVYSSSSSAYGDTDTLPKVESAEPNPMSPYAAAKLAGEQYMLAFGRAQRIEAIALRYFNVFGPRQDPNSAYAAVIPAFLSAAFSGDVATVFGDGHQTRDFTYVSNVVDANLLAAKAPAERANGTVLNVGAGERTSLLTLIQLIREITGRRLAYRNAAPRHGDVKDSLAGLDRAKDAIGYEPIVSLREGLTRTWHWFKNAEIGASEPTGRSRSVQSVASSPQQAFTQESEDP